MWKGLIGTGGLSVAFILFLAINMISEGLFSGRRIDLTEGKIFTLSQGSKNIVTSLDEPIKLQFYYSEKLANNIPGIHGYAMRVLELLREYETSSDGRIDLEVIDPEPFTDAEDQAVAAGIQPLPKTPTENLYFGLLGSNQTDQRQSIPFFSPEKEAFLEYDITAMVYNLANPERRRVGVISSLPIMGTRFDPRDPASFDRSKMKEPWVIIQAIRQMMDVTEIPRPLAGAIEDVDVLMIVQPSGLTPADRYWIDQFIIGGGRALIFADPHAEVMEVPMAGDNPMQAMTAPKGYSFDPIFKAWGIAIDNNNVLADRKLAQRVQLSASDRMMVEFIMFPAFTSANMNKDDYIVSGLELLKLWVPGVIEKLEGSPLEVEPLVTSTADSGMISVEKARFFPNPRELIAAFQPDDKVYTVAARLRGTVPSAYGPTPPAGITNPDHLAASSEPINVILVADADMLEDRFWVETQNMLGSRMMFPSANNGDFVANALDQLSGSSDLISVRNRGKFSRPFDVVLALEEEAKQELYAKAQQLEASLRDLERKISELQRQDAAGNRLLTLTEEQQQEVVKFQEQRMETRRELRAVQRSLRSSIESLGTRLKFINIGLMPLLVGILAVTLGVVKVKRRRRR